MPPFAFPLGSGKCWSSRMSRIWEIYSGSMLDDLKKIFSVVKHLWTASMHFTRWLKQGLAPPLGMKIWCVPTVINSGTAALSVELPPEPPWTITQGGDVEKCEFDPVPGWWIAVFFFFVAHQHFYSAVNLPGTGCNFSPHVGLHLFAHSCCFFMHFMQELLVCYAENKHLHRRSDSKVCINVKWVDKLERGGFAL